MLKRWSLGGFKSFGSKIDLEIAPLTIFAGSNSSGKSTLIQSILLLKQTIQYGSPNRPLALNGPLIRLGTFDDVIHFNRSPKEITMGFCFEVERPSSGRYRRTPWLNSVSRQISVGPGLIERVEGSFVWEPRSTGKVKGKLTFDKLQSKLTFGELKVFSSASKEAESQLENFIEYSPTRSRASQSPGSEDSQVSPSLMNVKIDALSKAEVTYEKPDSQIDGMYPRFFLPGYIMISFDQNKKRANEIAKSLFASNTLLGRRVPDGTTFSKTIIALMNQWLLQNKLKPIDGSESEMAYAVVYDHLRSLRRTAEKTLGLLRESSPTVDFSELQSKIEDALVSEKDSTPERELEIEIPRLIDRSCDFIQNFLKSGVRYLGPLRDEPKPVYPLEALENPTDVGYHGEHTAAVLNLHGNTTIRFIGPEDLGKDEASRRFRDVRLSDAVKEWLKYMGVATDVVTADAGVFGNQLQVATEGLSKRHDLTNVGVGVSQVLPIVVSALLAPPTSLLIFEQPELHLHPRVQARLADFFYSIVLLDKQCILESHSEYMIDRFRRRIAEEETNELQSKLAIYFTERVDGATQCRKVNITRYGAINDWPKDFFEQSQLEVKQILEAASKKRLREKNN